MSSHKRGIRRAQERVQEQRRQCRDGESTDCFVDAGGGVLVAGRRRRRVPPSGDDDCGDLFSPFGKPLKMMIRNAFCSRAKSVSTRTESRRRPPFCKRRRRFRRRRRKKPAAKAGAMMTHQSGDIERDEICFYNK